MRGPMSELPLVFDRVSQTLGGVQVLRDVELTIAPGAPSAIVGPNGSGKSTLLRIAMGPVSYTHLTLPTNREV